MRSLLAILSKFDVVRRRAAVSRAACFAGACVALLWCDEKAVHAADLSSVLPTKAPPQSSTLTAYDWSGLYVGMQAGYAWGSSNWTVPGSSSGSLNLAQPIDTFNEAGSWFLGLQAGYDYMLPNRFVIGGVVDASFPSFQTLAGISIGDISPAFVSPNGPETYSETMLDFGTIRGRIGYAPGNWLFYATGGLAWAYDRLTLTQLNSGTTDLPFLWRFGWAAGAGVEVPVAPHWTASLEYLFTDYGNSSGLFANAGQRFTSDFTLHELRSGLNYRFGKDGTSSGVTAPETLDPDILNFHGQATFTWQGYPAFRSPYQGTNSLPGSGLGRETIDAILFVGVRLWQGAEFWIDPEIDQGHGLAETHGVAGFTSGESYKLGFSYPYARANRYFIRQTIDLGGDSEKVDADANQFAGSQTANRLVLWAGKFYILDVFDTNKYANNPRADFLNWSVINNGAFDFGGDAWSDSYGAAAELYQGSWAFRAGIFDMSQTPAGGGGDSALSTVSTQPSVSSRSSEKSRTVTPCGVNPARSSSPVFSSAETWEIMIMPSRSPKRRASMSATRWQRCAPIRAGRECYSTLSSS